jgi:hypothetical protein
VVYFFLNYFKNFFRGCRDFMGVSAMAPLKSEGLHALLHGNDLLFVLHMYVFPILLAAWQSSTVIQRIITSILPLPTYGCIVFICVNSIIVHPAKFSDYNNKCNKDVQSLITLVSL